MAGQCEDWRCAKLCTLSQETSTKSPLQREGATLRNRRAQRTAALIDNNEVGSTKVERKPIEQSCKTALSTQQGQAGLENGRFSCSERDDSIINITVRGNSISGSTSRDLTSLTPDVDNPGIFTDGDMVLFR